MTRKQLWMVTPLLIIGLLLLLSFLYELIAGGGPDGWRYEWTWALARIAVLLLSADVAIKCLFAKKKKHFVYWTELLVCLGLLYWWIVS